MRSFVAWCEFRVTSYTYSGRIHPPARTVLSPYRLSILPRSIGVSNTLLSLVLLRITTFVEVYTYTRYIHPRLWSVLSHTCPTIPHGPSARHVALDENSSFMQHVHLFVIQCSKKASFSSLQHKGAIVPKRHVHPVVYLMSTKCMDGCLLPNVSPAFTSRFISPVSWLSHGLSVSVKRKFYLCIYYERWFFSPVMPVRVRYPRTPSISTYLLDKSSPL